MLLSAIACSSDTVIVLEIDTNLAVPQEMDGVRVVVGTVEKQLMDNNYALADQSEIPATLGITAINDKEATVQIEVFGLKGKEPVAWGETEATFVKGETVDAKVFLTKGVPQDSDGGTDAGGRDAGFTEDAGIDAADAEDLSDVSPDGGPGDTGNEDSGGDVGDRPDVSDLPDAESADVSADGNDAGVADTGAQIGFSCDPDAGCGNGLECYQDFPGGYCTHQCPPDCPEGAVCMVPPGNDAGVCTRTCVNEQDCVFREGFICLSVGMDADLCSYPPDGGSADSGSDPDTGLPPQITISANPATSKTGIGETIQFNATYFDGNGNKVEGVEFVWNSNPGCIWFGDPGTGRALRLGACTVTAFANGVTGEYPITVYPIVTTFAGSGEPGSVDGPWDVARFEDLMSGAQDSADGMYVVDSTEYHLRYIDRAGNVATQWERAQIGCDGGTFENFVYTNISDITDKGGASAHFWSDAACNKIESMESRSMATVFASALKGYVDGDLSVAQTRSPQALSATAGGLFFSDVGNYAIRLLNLTKNEISTFAGSGVGGFKDGPLAGSMVSIPVALFFSHESLLYFVEGNRIRTSDGGTVSSITRNAVYGYKDGLLENAEFGALRGVYVAGDGGILASDHDNHCVRYVDPERKSVITIAGADEAGHVDGLGSDARFQSPGKIFHAYEWQYVYVLDKTSIRKLKIKHQ